MGKLATAGAIAGLGRGLVNEQARQDRKTAASNDAIREERIRMLAQEFQTKRDDKNHQQDLEKVGLENANRTQLETNKLKAEQEKAAKEEEGRNKRNAETNATQKDIATMRLTEAEKRAKEKAGGGGKGGGSGAWLKTVVPGASTAKDGVVTTGEPSLVVTHKPSAQTFKQVVVPITENGQVKGYDNRFYPPGIDPQGTRRASPAAVQFLTKNPSHWQAFLHDYGYLPATVVEKLSGDMSDQQTAPEVDTSASDNSAYENEE